jgi:hypothetical protein
MTVQYATTADIYALGLTAPAFMVRPRPLDGRQGDYLDFTTGTFALSAHGLSAQDLVRIVLIASGGAIPTGASTTRVYGLAAGSPLDFWRFQLALVSGGVPIAFSDAGTTAAGGTSAWGIQVDPEPRLNKILRSASADIDQDLTAHATPILPDPLSGLFPDKLVGIVARVAARRAIAGLQFENPAFKAASERLFAEEKRDDEQRAAWRLGQPLMPTPPDQDGIADVGMRAHNAYTSSTYGRSLTRCPPHWNRGAL